eukprot:gene12843-17217_t
MADTSHVAETNGSGSNHVLHISATGRGEEVAAKLISNLIVPAFELKLTDLESLCKASLDLYVDRNSLLSKYEATKANLKKLDKNKNSADFFDMSKLNTYNTNQIKNQSIRFSLDESPNLPRSSWVFGSFAGRTVSGNENETHDYEDVLALDILKAPICDMCIIQPGESVPNGYYRLYKTSSNKKANLNTNSGGNPIYLCVKKDLHGQSTPITNLIVIFPDRNEYVPPGYLVVQRGKNACNINTGTSAERIYICYKKDISGNPITDVQIIFPAKGEEPPKSFQYIEKSMTGVPANLNTGNGGWDTFISYSQHLLRLECLENEQNTDMTAGRAHSRHSSGNLSKNYSSENTDSLTGNGNISSPITKTRSSTELHHSKTAPASTTIASQVSPVMLDRKMGLTHSESSHMSPILEISNEGKLDDISQDNNVGRRESIIQEDISVFLKNNDSSKNLDSIEEVDENDPALLQIDSMDDIEEVAQNANRRIKPVVDCDGNIAPTKSRKALRALLSALYCRRGNIAESALAALSKLLKETDFYQHDLKGMPLSGTTTMIDLTVEAVCDRLDLAIDSEHNTVLHLLKVIIRYSGAKLSMPSLQKLFRSISFLCSSYSTKSGWIIAGLGMPCNDPGADITPFKVFKQLISDTVSQVESVGIVDYLPDADTFPGYRSADSADESESYADVLVIVEDLVEDIIDSVETSRISESVFLLISRQTTTTTSSTFWQQINKVSKKLFSDQPNRSAFITICGICKLAWNSVRIGASGDPISRDLGAKLIALEAITEFCLSAGEKMRWSKIMGYQIRRIVIPCLLYNVSYALVDHRIMAKVLRIVTALWKNWRHAIRIEFAIICEQLVIPVLQASVIQIRPIFQMLVLEEVVNWFDQPHLLIEMFVNYDMDRKFVSHWNTFSHLVRTVCAIGRRLTMVTGAWNWRPEGAMNVEESNKISVTIRDVHFQALEEVGRMAKTLMDASGHAHLIQQDTEFRNRSMATGAGWIEDEDISGKIHSAVKVESVDSVDGSNNIFPERPVLKKRVGSIKFRREAHTQAEELINQAIKIYTEKNSLQKAVKYLLSMNFMADTPQEIANFLRVYKNSFDPGAIGDFLGEGGTCPTEEDYWSQIRFRYTRAVSFVEMDLEPALRLYLTGCGFRMPGEAQKINRFVEVFVKAFWQDNSGTKNAPFRHPDTVHLLSYAIIMLNTDLHKANNDNKKKKNKMTKEAFINNLRGVDQDANIDHDYLSRIYDNVANQPIEMEVRSAIGSNSGRDIEDKKKNSDLAANALSNKALSSDARIAEEKAFIRETSVKIRDSEDLLRSLAPFTFRFQLTGVDTKISLDLVSYMYETVWYHFHAIVESLLNDPNSDMNVKIVSLDILRYSLTSAIFLNLKVERMTFSELLRNFQDSLDTQGSSLSADDSWYEDVEAVDPVSAMSTIAKVHHLIVAIKDAVQEISNFELTRAVAAKFEKKARILETNTFFVRQGDLSKLNRAGRAMTYKFFLFSDNLIYAHMNMQNLYKVHEQLSLDAMVLQDVDNDPTFSSFFISHPVKSFIVVAENPQLKQQWFRDIQKAITSCKQRENAKVAKIDVAHATRRMSLVNRMEDQQSIQKKEEEIFRAVSPTERSPAMTRIALRRPSVQQDAPYQNVPFSLQSMPEENEDDITQEKLEIDLDLLENVSVNIQEKTPPLPTAEERAISQQENIKTFNETIQHLTENQLTSLFNAGVTFYKGTFSSRGAGSADPSRLKLFGLYRQVRFGNADSSLLVGGEATPMVASDLTSSGATTPTTGLDKFDSMAMTNEQLLAWRDCNDKPQEDAKREFLIALFQLAPYWKYEQFL